MVVALVREPGGDIRKLLYFIFGHMLFGFMIGLPSVSVMGLIGIIVTIMWQLHEEAEQQRRTQEQSQLHQRIRELEEKTAERPSWDR